MVRHYESKGLRAVYTEEDRKRALNLFVFHKCVMTVSRLTGIPSSTLYDWIGLPDRPLGTGKKCALKKWEEDDLVAIIVYTSEHGIPKLKKILTFIVIIDFKENITNL